MSNTTLVAIAALGFLAVLFYVLRGSKKAPEAKALDEKAAERKSDAPAKKAPAKKATPAETFPAEGAARATTSEPPKPGELPQLGRQSKPDVEEEKPKPTYEQVDALIAATTTNVEAAPPPSPRAESLATPVSSPLEAAIAAHAAAVPTPTAEPSPIAAEPKREEPTKEDEPVPSSAMELDADAIEEAISVKAPQPAKAPPVPPARPPLPSSPRTSPVAKPASAIPTPAATPAAKATPSSPAVTVAKAVSSGSIKAAPPKPELSPLAQTAPGATRSSASMEATGAAPAPSSPAVKAAPSAETAVAAPAPARVVPASLAAKLAAMSNPATAELEKADPRHAAARKFARLAVSEIKLYHEDEVKTGREVKDLWKRLSVDIGLAYQTYEKRVEADVRDRFDYLRDEILRQLAENDEAKLGPDAPKAKPAPEAPAAEAPAQAPVPAPVPEAPAPVAAPAPTLEPLVAREPEAARPEPIRESTTTAVAKPAAAPSSPAVKAAPSAEAAVAAPAPARVVPASLAAKLAAMSNPATAELEKADPRHAAARKFARLAVSEIKLYHEDEVKTGREVKDLWKRLSVDIGLAYQTYEKRVEADVRDRFDYLRDEILRQLAENDEAKLGPDAPKAKPAPEAPAAEAPAPAPAPAPAQAPEAPAPAFAEEPETTRRDVPEELTARATPTSPPEPAPAKVIPSSGKLEAAPPAEALSPAPEPPKAPAPTPAAPATAAPGRGVPASLAAKLAAMSNPATAELEKADPRHAAARKFARLAVSEIKLYHEDDVKAGREAKDLWKRLSVDIGLASQTYEKRIEQDVRDRFDYLYDEILRQLAEGDAAKLGPEAPKPKSAS